MKRDSIRITPIKKVRDIQPEVSVFGRDNAEQVRAFHKTFAEYSETPLVSLHNLATQMGVAGLYVKDESKRFGLNAFKVLGGSYAIHKILESGAVGEKPVFCTTTDGNHGRGVAWAASRLGYEAHVHMPKGTAEERLRNIQKTGAYADILPMGYDDAVRYAEKEAKENGWVLVQDATWDGYEEIPTYIMQGYTTMAAEICDQLGDVVPTHLFLQAGVGSMAGAVAAYFVDRYGAKHPKIIVVEPTTADCFYQTAQAADGSMHVYEGEMTSLMAGLCCGTPCPVAWDIIEAHGDACVACEDAIYEYGMRLLAKPMGSDVAIISGESGAVTPGLAAAVCMEEELEWARKQLGIDANSVVVCISTEGDTNRENYERIVNA